MSDPTDEDRDLAASAGIERMLDRIRCQFVHRQSDRHDARGINVFTAVTNLERQQNGPCFGMRLQPSVGK